MDPPKKREITMTWSILASVKDFHIFVGKIATSVDMKPLNSLASYSAPVGSKMGNRPALLKMLAKTRPMTQAMAVVTRKYNTVFMPTVPTFRISFMERMPSIMDRSTTGTTINFKRFTKMSPKGFK